MDAEVPHLLFRWVHVVAGVMWVGQLWSLVLIHRSPAGGVLDPAVMVLALRTHRWMRWAATGAWVTGIPLLGIVYYGGGALTTVNQSTGVATAIGLACLVAAWLVYDSIWIRLVRHRIWAGLLSFVLLMAAAAGLQRLMTGRAMLIHLGAMLGTIMLANVWRRIWPIECRRLTTPPGGSERQRPADVEIAAMRLRHNASIALAVILFMVSNHFPLVHGRSFAWLIGTGIVLASSLLAIGVPARSSPAPASSHSETGSS